MKNIKLIKIALEASLVDMIETSRHLWKFFIGVLVVIFANLYFYVVIFHHKFVFVDRYGFFWKEPDLWILIGFTNVTYYLSEVFLLGIWLLSRTIIEGDLESYLVLPVNPILAILLRRFNLTGLIGVVMGFLLFISAYLRFYTFDILKFILAIFSIIPGLVLFFLIYFLLNLLTFWIGKVDAVRIFFFYLSRNFSNIPTTVLPMFLIWIFMVFVPVFFTSTFPVLIISEKLSLHSALNIILIEVVLAGILLRIDIILWQKGIKIYSPAGG